jgi:protein gp37
MFRDKVRYGQNPEVVVRSRPATFNAPLKWRDPARVFTCSWSDWFHPAADPWRDEAWDVIRRTPHLTYQILTKRANRIAGHLPEDWGAAGYPNVWLGVSVEHQATAFRLDQPAAVPAAVRFVSYEPALGPLDLAPYLQGEGCFWCYGEGVLPGTQRPCRACPPKVGWVIVGGESGGKEARPFDLAWAREAVRQCRAARAAPFVKQLGSVWARAHGARDWHGGDWTEWVEDLRVRAFPDGTVVPAPSVEDGRA